MGLSVKEEWIEAYARLLRDGGQTSAAIMTKDPARLEAVRPFSHLACTILRAFSDDCEKSGSRLKISALRPPSESDLTFASAIRELTSAGLVRMAPGFRLELTSLGRDAIVRWRSL